jgi:hypothetical protein
MYDRHKLAHEVDREKRDKDFILNPNAWPNWPILPLKRYVRVGTRTTLDTACLFENGNMKFSIAEDANMFALMDPEVRKTTIWKPTTVDEVIAAGWIVD